MLSGYAGRRPEPYAATPALSPRSDPPHGGAVGFLRAPARWLARVLRLEGQHTQCVHTWLARGCSAPLRTPGLSRRCRSTGRTGAQPPNPCTVPARRSGAPLWSSPTSPRRSRSPSARRRRPSGSPTPGSGAHEAASGVRGLPPDLSGAPSEDRAAYGGLANLRVDPPQAGPDAFPQGSLAPQARAGSDPERGKRGGKSRPSPGRPSRGWRGVAPSPVLPPKRENGSEADWPKANGDRGFREPRGVREAAKAAAKGGCSPFAAKG